MDEANSKANRILSSSFRVTGLLLLNQLAHVLPVVDNVHSGTTQGLLRLTGVTTCSPETEPFVSIPTLPYLLHAAQCRIDIGIHRAGSCTWLRSRGRKASVRRQQGTPLSVYETLIYGKSCQEVRTRSNSRAHHADGQQRLRYGSSDRPCSKERARVLRTVGVYTNI